MIKTFVTFTLFGFSAPGNPRKDESLKDQYANYKKVYGLWKAHEAHYKEVARDLKKRI